MPYDLTVFQNPEASGDSELVVATYYLETDSPDLVKKAGEIAVGQTTGGWVDLPRADRELMERVVGRVLAVHEIPPDETRAGSGGGLAPRGEAAGGPTGNPRRTAIFRIGFPAANVAGDLGALLVAVYGKVSLDGAIKLIDLEIPPSLAKRLPGPRHGIQGIRRTLGPGAETRPLLMSIFKPALGLKPEALAEMLGEQASAGVDLVKDDEVLVDETVDTALRRLELGLKAVDRAKTGRTHLYAVHLNGPAEELLPRARRLSKAGAGCLLFNALAYGIPTLCSLARDPEVTAPLMAHPALGGGIAMEPTHGIAAHLVMGKLLRLAGADLVLYPSPYGSVALRRESALKLAFALTRPLFGLKPAFPVPSAGITPSLVPQLLADHGHDVVVNAGGAVHGHPDGARAGAEAFRQAIRAALEKIPLTAAADTSPALKKALEIWK